MTWHDLSCQVRGTCKWGPGWERSKTARGRPSRRQALCWVGREGPRWGGLGAAHTSSFLPSYQRPPSSHPALTSEFMPPLKLVPFISLHSSSSLEIPFVWWIPLPQDQVPRSPPWQSLPWLRNFPYTFSPQQEPMLFESGAFIFFLCPGPGTMPDALLVLNKFVWSRWILGKLKQ